MPTLVSVAIPTISPLRIKPRFYDDAPLPIKADTNAPKNARIVNRVLESGVATFEIKIGETTFSDVGLHEILEYVSAYELEDYENRAFEQERELLKILEEEEERRRQEKTQRQREKARLRGVAELRSRSDEDGDGQDEDMAVGKHGRARPSYKRFVKPLKERRRRKRDPNTGELMPLSDEDEAVASQLESSEDDRLTAHDSKVAQHKRATTTNPIQLPVRRRRKRDPATGELLPLDPIPAGEGVENKKRPRRRRHPVTGELMPLGWRYDQESEGRIDSSTDGSVLLRTNLAVPEMGRLSLDHEQEPKRRRLDRSSEHPVVALPSPAKVKTTHLKGQDVLAAFKTGSGVIDLAGSDDSSDGADAITVTQVPGPKPKLLRRSVGGASIAQPATAPAQPSVQKDSLRAGGNTTVHSRSSSTAVPLVASAKKSASNTLVARRDRSTRNSSAEPSPARSADRPRPHGEVTTSILHNSATSPHRESSGGEDGEMADEQEQLDDDEFIIEGILSHHDSDPKTHPPEFGAQPVMLYQVAWAGWPEPTWEPLSSFGDLEVVRQYQRKVGMPVEPED